MSNRTVSLSFLAVLSFCLLAGARTAPAQTAEPKTVMDYYLLLTKEELPWLEATKKSRKELVKVQDMANGYLELSDKDLQGVTQIALFRKKDHAALIGVSETEETVAWNGSVKFWRYRDGKWSDVTGEVWPTVADKEILAAYDRTKTKQDEKRSLEQMPSIYYELPKKGTTVELRCGEDSDSQKKVLLRFAWDGAHFTKQAK